MQDNYLKHSAKVERQGFSEKKIGILDWPAQSLNLNLIENSWHDAKSKIYSKEKIPKF